MNIIIKADDFGHSLTVNLGIIEAYQKGVVTSTSIMTNMPGWDHALDFLKSHPQFCVGVHANLVEGIPLTKAAQVLVNEKGVFYPENFESRAESQIVKDEVRAQILKLIEAGIEPSHLDSHYHIHTMEKFWSVFFDLALEFKLPLRIRGEKMKNAARQLGIPTTDILIEDFFCEPSAQKLTQKLNEILDHKKMHQAESDRSFVVEIMVHPVCFSEEDSRVSDYHFQRRSEMVELMRIHSENLWKTKKFYMLSYQDLKDRGAILAKIQ
jgi:predicted glycoside hydrolase/deacetylase ChbG (UPF0249 family)